jgi:cell pole-organizing protein PopZ
LLSRPAAAAVNAEFTALANAVSADWDPRFEELARRMLRPMLRAWLDRHLPGIVRRMVREEIERISRGR